MLKCLILFDVITNYNSALDQKLPCQTEFEHHMGVGMIAIMDKEIQSFKFNGDLRAGRILAGLMQESLLERAEKVQALVPVPLFRKRLVERGFNQSLELARDLGKGLEIPVLAKHLVRIRDTRAQSELGAAKRRANVRGAFAVKAAEGLPASVAIVEDVMSTGSTLNECAHTLKMAGVEYVEVWVIARAS